MEEMLAKLSKKKYHPALNVEFNLPFSSKSYLLTATIKKTKRHCQAFKQLKGKFLCW